jgi:hypothetical protein
VALKVVVVHGEAIRIRTQAMAANEADMVEVQAMAAMITEAIVETEEAEEAILAVADMVADTNRKEVMTTEDRIMMTINHPVVEVGRETIRPQRSGSNQKHGSLMIRSKFLRMTAKCFSSA